MASTVKTFTRKGNLGGTVPELSYPMIDDDENTLIIMDAGKYAMLTLDAVQEDGSVANIPYEPTADEINAARQVIRQMEYQRSADPLALKMLRDEANREEWDAERNRIKAKWPEVV